ncbi:fimbrial protein [Citrobacter braakii]|uniref:fimbrial protein n=1 Tax=Citrobacter braakii TaxID=57706 RepID=UPI00351D6B25
MKKNLTLSVSALLLALSSLSAHAVDANINFSGNVSSGTCTLNAADAAKTLALPDVSPQTLYNAGSNAYQTYNASGSFNFTNCPEGLTKVTSKYIYNGFLVSNFSGTAYAAGDAQNIGLILMQSPTASSANIVNVNGSSSVVNETPIIANAASVPVTVGIAPYSPNGDNAVPTVGQYTGTYTVSFTYS